MTKIANMPRWLDCGVCNSVAFCSIDEMQAACEAGWSARYCQVQPGDFTELIDNRTNIRHTMRHASAPQSWYTLIRAKEYIDAHLQNAISIGKVCKHAAISARTLERIFRSEWNMTPSEYILARRLAAANRKLRHSRCTGTRVTQIAMECGFNHLGRFSGAYRMQFGELPSETLRSR